MLNSPEEIEKATDEMDEIKAVIKARYGIILCFNFFFTYAPIEYPSHLSDLAWQKYVRSTKIVSSRNMQECETIEALFKLANEGGRIVKFSKNDNPDGSLTIIDFVEALLRCGIDKVPRKTDM